MQCTYCWSCIAFLAAGNPVMGDRTSRTYVCCLMVLPVMHSHVNTTDRLCVRFSSGELSGAVDGRLNIKDIRVLLNDVTCDVLPC